MNTKRRFFLSYLFIAPIIVAVSQASVLEFQTRNLFPEIFYFPILIGLFLLTIGALTTSVFETIKHKDIPDKYGWPIWVLSLLAFLYLFWFGINLSQRMVIVDYLDAINPTRSPFLGIFYLPTTPQVYPKMGFLPFYTIIVVGVIAALATVAYCHILFMKKRR
jgi:hypothetical protein